MIIQGDETGRCGLPLAERIDPAARALLDVRERAGLEIIEARLPGPFRVLFTTRLGGTSTGPYASLNLHERSNDDPAHVRRNRALVAAALADEPAGLDPPAAGSARDVALARTPGGDLVAPDGGSTVPGQDHRLVSPLQVHGTRVVGAAEYLAAHGASPEPAEPCDGLTLHPLLDRGLAALLLFADCVPIVLVGDVDMAVVHGGWRGVLGGVIERAASAMTGPPGLAVIGPSIGPCCFTVGEDVADGFARRFGAEVAGRGRVDLWAAVAAALLELGVAPIRIVNPRLCTACNRDLFYSHRMEGPETGRQGCVAWTVGS